MYWMISNRNRTKNGLGSSLDDVTYWAADGTRPLDQFASWEKASGRAFQSQLVNAAAAFPAIADPAKHEDQKHVALFLHGFNNGWDDAARRYRGIADDLFTGDSGLGILILFSWPSEGLKTGYYPDRLEARRAADGVADVLTSLFDWVTRNQSAAMADPGKACKAKVSVIAHSMGNFVLQRAMQAAWTRNNQPLLVSLVNQLLMVAADVDNDLFGAGEAVDQGDGDAIANLTYRVSALYSPRDATLGLSAGFKHFGKRRLGRSGLDRTAPLPDNVWDIDCSRLMDAALGGEVHSAYFDQPKTKELMRRILRGLDRTIVQSWADSQASGQTTAASDGR
jgi:esterase/lipase superfamily enzyme